MSFTADLSDIVSRNSNGLLSAHETWQRTPLATVADVINGFPFNSSLFDKQRGVPLIRIRDILKTSTDCKFTGEVPEGYWVEPGDIVIGMDGDFNAARWSGPRSLLNQRVCKLTVDERFMDRRFVFWCLGGYLAAINAETPSITVKHLSSKTIGAVPIPLPPRREQQRIADKLDTLLARVDACRDRLARVAPLLKRFRQSVLAAASSGRLTEEFRHVNGHEISTVPFERLLSRRAGSLKRGPFGSSIKKAFFVPAGFKVYEQKNAIQDDETLGHYFLDEAKFAELEEFAVAPGDFIVSCAGTIGRISRLSDSAPKGVINQALMRVRIDEDVVSAPYFRLLFEAPSFQAAILEKTQGSAMQNMAAVKVIKQVAVTLPGLIEQAEIVRRVDTLFAYADRLEARLAQAQAAVDRLTPSLLAKAFRGELAPQDPADEPAAELLKRLAAQRADAGAAPVRRRGRAKASGAA